MVVWDACRFNPVFDSLETFNFIIFLLISATFNKAVLLLQIQNL